MPVLRSTVKRLDHSSSSLEKSCESIAPVVGGQHQTLIPRYLTIAIRNAVGDKYTKFLRDAYAVKNAAFKGTSAEDAHETQQKPSLFKTGQQLLQVCHDLVISHEEADRKVSERNSEITDRLEQIRAHWSSDMVQLDEILQFGFDYGVKIVECSVSPSTSDEKKSQILTPDRRSFREAGQTVLDMYQKSTEKLSVVPTWGEEVKNYTEKMLAVVAVSEKLD